MRNNSIWMIALAMIFLVSCAREDSDSVDQDKIFTEYSIFYNENQDITYARAKFKFSNVSGTALELSDSSSVTFNGTELAWKPGLAYYEYEIAGRLDSGTFVWTDTEGTSYTNSFGLHEVNYPTNFDTVSTQASYTFAWLGDAIMDNESIALIMDGLYENDLKIFSENGVGATSMVLGVNHLSDIAVGEASCFLDRYYNPAIQEAPSAGGLLTGHYRPTNKTVIME